MTRGQTIVCIALALLIGWFGKCVYDDYVASLDEPKPADQSIMTPAPAGSVLLTAPQPVPQPVQQSGGSVLTPSVDNHGLTTALTQVKPRRSSPAVPIPNPDFKVPAEPRGGYRRLPSGAVNDLRGS